MSREEHSVPRKITSCPALWVLPEDFLRDGSCLRPLSKKRHAASHKSVSFLGSPQLKREVCRVDKLDFWRQEVLFRNNVPFPAAQDCQPYGCFWFRRNSRACFLYSPNALLSTPHRPSSSVFSRDHVSVVSSQGRKQTHLHPSHREQDVKAEDLTFPWHQ